MGWTPEPHFDDSRNEWFLKFQRQKHHLCSGRGNYARAVTRAREIMGLPPLGEVPIDKPQRPATKPATVTELIARWAAINNPSDWTRGMLKAWHIAFGTTDLREVDADHLTVYKTWLESHPTAWDRTKKQFRNHTPRPQSAATIRYKIKTAKRVLKWAHKRGWVPEQTVPKLRKATQEPRDYRPDQLAVLWDKLREAKRRRLALPPIQFIVETGARPGEVVGMEWSDVNLADGEVTLYEHKTKGSTGESRVIPLTPAARAILEQSPRREGYVFISRLAKPYTVSGLRSVICRAAKAVGLKLGRLYSLRHTRAQSMLEQGCSLEEVANQLGHKDLNITKRYAQVRRAQAREVASRLASPLPEAPTASTLTPTPDSPPPCVTAAPEPSAADAAPGSASARSRQAARPPRRRRFASSSSARRAARPAAGRT
ncbi:MAG TPA: site-specific integrase [Phycisphaerae bacterium]|nr:site-specific integrase [Phycisphaerae bacterium]HRY69025.1 site-specific integrase [Phycisphaerae bacterium]HSA26000.1 site-specific integrase [Phycisphaerae bacterium]